ncbi:DEGP1 [Symbiodinium microadriaticum]|nr:DEGP1 [Symbiodinium microadriaticum]
MAPQEIATIAEKESGAAFEVQIKSPGADKLKTAARLRLESYEKKPTTHLPTLLGARSPVLLKEQRADKARQANEQKKEAAQRVRDEFKTSSEAKQKTLEQQLEKAGENREEGLASIKKKAAQHIEKVIEVKDTSKQKGEMTAEEARERLQQALLKKSDLRGQKMKEISDKATKHNEAVADKVMQQKEAKEGALEELRKKMPDERLMDMSLRLYERHFVAHAGSPWQRVATFASALVLTAVLTLQGSLPTPLPAQAFEELSSGEVQTVDLFQRNTPGVVYITKEVFKFANAGKMMEIQMVPEGSGTGWVYDLEGHIVTNYHVIENAQAVTVKFIEGTEVLAKVVGADPYSDVAVLQVDLSKTKKEMLRPLSRGSSANLRVGQEVLAIGNPFGLDHTLTKGIVSGVGRTIQSVGGRPIQGAIQTDASINPGNSGGPLLNSRGQVIGMNTAIFSPSGASAGVGFAIPSDTVAARVASILKPGARRIQPSLGLYLGQDGLAQRLSGRPGGLISGLQRSSAAAEAGLKPGDIVLKIDERNISTVNDIFAVLDEHQPGDVIKAVALLHSSEDTSGIDVKAKIQAHLGMCFAEHACFHFFCQSAGYAMQEKLFAADGTGKKSLDCRKHRRRKRKRACTGEVMAAKVGGAVASKLSSEAGAVSNGPLRGLLLRLGLQSRL